MRCKRHPVQGTSVAVPLNPLSPGLGPRTLGLSDSRTRKVLALYILTGLSGVSVGKVPKLHAGMHLKQSPLRSEKTQSCRLSFVVNPSGRPMQFSRGTRASRQPRGDTFKPRQAENGKWGTLLKGQRSAAPAPTWPRLKSPCAAQPRLARRPIRAVTLPKKDAGWGCW